MHENAAKPTTMATAIAIAIAIFCTSAIIALPNTAFAMDFDVRIDDCVYTGAPQQPPIAVSSNGTPLERGIDYVTSWRHNVNIGEARVTITGKGVYAGTRTSATFTIAPADIANAVVSGISKSYGSTGSPIEPAMHLTFGPKALKRGRDYDVSFENNVSPGTATIAIRGKRNLAGTKTVTFRITDSHSNNPSSSTGATTAPAKLSIDKATISVDKQEWTGKKLKPKVTVTYGQKPLVLESDYSVSYRDNVEVGKAQVTITGKGAYAGSKSATFKIVARSLAKAKIATITSRLRTGAGIKPNVTVRFGTKKLEAGIDYQVSYRNNKNIGTANVTITGRGHYRGSKKTTFEILPNPGDRIAAAAVALAGYEASGNNAPPSYGKSSKRVAATKAPPNKGHGGNWSVYNKVFKSIMAIKGGWKLNHLCCDCLPVLAVRWSGADDAYYGRYWVDSTMEYAYLANSDKWDYVGTWKSNSGHAKTTEGKQLQPGDILCKVNPKTGKPGTKSGSYRHWLVFVGSHIAELKWPGTKNVFVDEGHYSRWACSKPLNARKSMKENYKVFRRNTKGYNPEESRYASVYPKELAKYLR